MQIVNTIAKESKYREKRENNLIIFGLDESKEKDKNKVADEDRKLIDSVFKN